MGEPKYCIKCKEADNGNGVWLSNKKWTDEFLRESNKAIIKRGRIKHVVCEKCEKEIRSRGHNVIQKGVK